MSTKELKTNSTNIWRGIKKTYHATVGVIEALAWLGLIATGYAVVWHVLKGHMVLNDVLFYAVAFSTLAISLRAAWELGDYFRKTGSDYEN